MYIQDAEWRYIVNPADKKEETYNLIEQIGRTCYQSEVKDIPEHGAKFVRQIVKRGHLGLLEHVNMTIEFLVDRGRNARNSPTQACVVCAGIYPLLQLFQRQIRACNYRYQHRYRPGH